MKRIGNLWPQIASQEALYRAYTMARKGKRRHHACHKFERQIGAQITSLERELLDGTYRPHEPNRFYVYEPKRRLIEAPAFRDLVVQHALYAVVMPIFERRFINTNFACRIGYGTHAAADYVQAVMSRAAPTDWVLKIDCRKYFYSIDHGVLHNQVERVIKCPQTLALLDSFIDCRGEPVGVPIGNLMSQVFGLVYLNDIDQFARRQLGLRTYSRYVDDMVMLVQSQAHGEDMLERITGRLKDALGLDVSKHCLQPIRRGVNCYGFRTWRTRRFIRKRSLYVASRSARRRNAESFVSCLGHARRSASFRHLLSLAEDNHDLRLPETIRRVRHLYPAHRSRPAVV